jgi:hypothetical protein
MTSVKIQPLIEPKHRETTIHNVKRKMVDLMEEEEEGEGEEDKKQEEENFQFSELLSNTSIIHLKHGTTNQGMIHSPLTSSSKKTKVETIPKTPKNNISYIYLIATFFENPELSPQTTINYTYDYETAMRDNQLTGAVTSSSSSSSGGNKLYSKSLLPIFDETADSNNPIRGYITNSMLMIPPGVGFEGLETTTPPSRRMRKNNGVHYAISQHTMDSTQNQNQKKIRKKFLAMLLLAVDKSEQMVESLKESWRNANRGLKKRATEGIRLAKKNNLLIFVGKELIEGDFQIDDIRNFYLQQAELRKQYLL